MVIDDDVPPIELVPPYSSEFLAHLHAGSYDDDLGIGVIWQRVMADPIAHVFIDALDQVRHALRHRRFDDDL